MKNFFSTMIASVALISAPVAYAQSYTPTGPTVFTGPVTATVGGTTMNCTLRATITVNSATSASLTGMRLTGGPLGACAAASITNLPQPIAFTSPNEMSAYVVATTFIGGNCQGTFTVTYSGGILTIPTQTLNAGGSTMSCTFAGTATPNTAFGL